MHSQWNFIISSELYGLSDLQFMELCDPTHMKATSLGSCKQCHSPLTVYSRVIPVRKDIVQAECKLLPNFSIEIAYAVCAECRQTRWAKATLFNQDDCVCRERKFSVALPRVN